MQIACTQVRRVPFNVKRVLCKIILYSRFILIHFSLGRMLHFLCNSGKNRCFEFLNWLVNNIISFGILFLPLPIQHQFFVLICLNKNNYKLKRSTPSPQSQSAWSRFTINKPVLFVQFCFYPSINIVKKENLDC